MDKRDGVGIFVPLSAEEKEAVEQRSRAGKFRRRMSMRRKWNCSGLTGRYPGGLKRAPGSR